MSRNIHKRYIRQIKRIYTGKKSSKRIFIKELEDAILCYLQDNPDSTYSDLVKEFGSPYELDGNLTFYSDRDLHKRNMFIHWGIISLCILAASAALHFTLKYLLCRYEYSQGHFIEYFQEDYPGDTDDFPNDTISIRFD